jgi:hypothetical protein
MPKIPSHPGAKSGNDVFFASNRTGSSQIWAVGVKTKTLRQITHEGGFAPFQTQDGAYIYYAKGRSEPGLWRVPTNGGKEELFLADLRSNYWSLWALSKRGVYFFDSVPELRGSGQFIGPLRPSILKYVDYRRASIRTVVRFHNIGPAYFPGLALASDESYVLFPTSKHGETKFQVVDPVSHW